MSSPDAARSGLREMTRQTVRSQIADRAMALFIEHGFDRTTIEQIAAEIGMSGRSVARYFASKEDMVVGNLTAIGQGIADRLAARPVDEPLWAALRHALDGHVEALDRDPDGRLLATSRMLAATPALRGALAKKQLEWQELLVPLVAARLDGERRELRARAITAAVLACLNTAVNAWTESGGTERVEVLLDVTLEAVASAAAHAH
ncbi:TetR family transcriptional regulator [Streptomyces sp. NPDC088354]|uniref:TetR family transcriptional regulator n=1 Tax=unclassified Streptomyces TaxID=2593676 RepID=UPI0029ADAA6F|nr:TetR family transcriptional regulator [Streptomyces sp. MI02-7b]MDX3071157.1 TetR family transcriptional regulator [Streptomyces sp. MI02-7b]